MNSRERTVDKSSARVRAMFGEIAPKYDFLNNLLSVGLAPGWRRKLVREVCARLAPGGTPLERPASLLDVATGTGDVVCEERRQWERLQKRGRAFAPALELTGVDFTPEMLAIARRRAPSERFQEADGCALPFEDCVFDAATISFGLRNMEDPAKGIREMTRVVRPGGVVAILEFSPPRVPVLSQLFRFYFHRILPAVGNRIARNNSDAYRYLPESVDAFDRPETVLEYMRAAGIGNAIRIPMTFGTLGLFIGEKGTET